MLRSVLTRRRVYDERAEPCPLHTPDDRFIPVRAEDLAHDLAAEFPDARPVVDRLATIIERESQALLRRFAHAYAPFNPDRDTIDIREHAGDAAARYAELRAVIEHVLENANFRPLDAVQMDAAIRETNSHGLRVRLDPEGVRELHVWMRGRASMQRRVRSFRHPWRGTLKEMTLCRRLIVFAWMPEAEADEAPGSGPVWLKMFRDIPLADLEALLPHAEVRMNWWDRFQAFGGAGGALGSTAYKIGSIATTVVKFYAFLWIAVLGLGTLAFRAFFGYRRAKSKRDAQRTQHLYYQNLANNAAAAHLLAANVAQEELKECVLAYALGRSLGPCSPTDLRSAIESHLKDRYDLDVRFDLADAMETMHRVGLADDPRRSDPPEPERAAAILDAYLASHRWEAYHPDLIDRRLESVDPNAAETAPPATQVSNPKRTRSPTPQPDESPETRDPSTPDGARA